MNESTSEQRTSLSCQLLLDHLCLGHHLLAAQAGPREDTYIH